MVEVLTSAAILLVVAVATLALLDQSARQSGENRSRSIAAGLAQADQEELRQLPMSRLGGGYSARVTKRLGGIDYTVASSARWTRDATGDVTCTSGSGGVSYLRTTSTVTWPRMRARPVVVEGIITPGVRALSALTGALTVSLTRADGSGTRGIGVAAGGISGVTDETGCVVLAGVPTGSQNVTYSASGHVDRDGNASLSVPVSIAAQSMSEYQAAYDAAGAVEVQIKDEAGAASTWPSVSVEHAQRPAGTFRVNRPTATASLVPVPSLFPFTSPYNVYVGGCDGNDPTSYLASFAGSSVLAERGLTKAVDGTLRRVTITVTNASNAPVTSAGIAAYPETADARMTGCTERIARQVMSSPTGQYQLLLPAGVYRVCADLTSGSNRARVLTIIGGASTTDEPVITSPAGTTGAYAPRLTTALRTPTPTSGGQLCT
jgi:hypothetical protein